jgi:hypothetical protein
MNVGDYSCELDYMLSEETKEWINKDKIFQPIQLLVCLNNLMLHFPSDMRTRPLLKRRYRWEDSIKTDLVKGMGWDVRNLIHIAQDRKQRWVVVNMVMNLICMRTYWLLRKACVPCTC